MTDICPAPSICGEYVPEGLRAALGAAGDWRSGMVAAAAQIVSSTVPDSAAVRLCLTGNFVGSVQDRFDADGIGKIYNPGRGSNLAAAKTMVRPDGTTDLIVPLWDVWLREDDPLDDDANTEDAEDLSLFLHNVLHESLHARLQQLFVNNASFDSDLGSLDENDRVFQRLAAEMLEEYIVEVSASAKFPGSSYIDNLPAAIEVVRESLRNALAHSDIDFDGAVEQVQRALKNYWMALMYVAAESRVKSVDLMTVSHLVSDAGWAQYGAPRWRALQTLLNAAPGALDVNERVDLRQIHEDLRDWMKAWITEAGFELRFLDNGGIWAKALRLVF